MEGSRLQRGERKLHHNSISVLSIRLQSRRGRGRYWGARTALGWNLTAFDCDLSIFEG